MPVTGEGGGDRGLNTTAVFAEARRYGRLPTYSIPLRYTFMRVILIGEFAS